MPLNLLDGLPDWGGFNRLEKEEYYRLFVDGQQNTVELLTMASEIAADNDWTLEDTVAKLQNAKANQLDAVMSLGESGLSKLVEFQERQNKAKLLQGFDLAFLVLQSRLSVEWLKKHQADLTEYGIEFDLDSITEIPRSEWLKNADRCKVIDQITSLIPARLLRPVEDYAYRELHEGKLPTNSADEGRDNDPLALPSESSTKPSKPERKNLNSAMTVTSASNQRASQTLATTGNKST